MFVENYRFDGNKTWNSVGPVVHWVFAQVTFVVIPILTFIYFLVMIYEKETRDSIVLPWIVANALIQLMTVIYTYNVIVKSCMQVSEKETRIRIKTKNLQLKHTKIALAIESETLAIFLRTSTQYCSCPMLNHGMALPLSTVLLILTTW